MDIFSLIGGIAIYVTEPFSQIGHRVFLGYLFSTLIICFFVYKHANIKTGFFKWLFPSKIYLHASHILDIKLFVFNRLLRLAGFFNLVAVSSIVTVLTVAFVGGKTAVDTTWSPLYVGLLMVVVNDFGVYWVHRIHHETTPLWPFHSVHHSAEVMTPITVYRKHPIYDLISSMVRGIFFGVLQGIMLGLFVGKVEIATVASINVFIVVFNFLGSNLRHSHVWLSFGPVLEHVFISPAQHQIHHSIDKKHWNKNYGEIFAIWDLMFGTLYVPKTREELQFGLTDEDSVVQPHDTLSKALWVPIKESWQSLRPSNKTEADKTQTPIVPGE